MWLDADSTNVFPKELKLQQSEDLRLGWIGNTFHLGVLCELAQPPLVEFGALPKELPRAALACTGRVRPIGGIAPFAPREQPVSDAEQKLVQAIARNAERGHTDVRLDTGTPYRPKCWPRGALRASLWRWRVATAWKWSDSEHINVLEARATLNTVRRRFRKASKHGHRFSILTDSQVCAAIFGKGRTGSRKVLPVLKKHNSLCLAAHGFPLIGYVPSSENPADVPSRWRAVNFSRRRSRPVPSGVRAKVL